MAVIQNELSFGSSPPWATIIEATETGRNGSSVTFKVTMKLKINRTTSSAYYGYGINWRATLNGTSSGLLKVKDASPRWYGGEAYRTFTTTITTSVGVSGGTLPLKIELLASGGGNISLNKTYNISYSTWNTPPSMSGSLNLNKSGIIPENTSDVTLSWNMASDSNNNLSGYQIYRYVNGSHNSTIEVGASTTSYTDNISGFGQGTQIYYKIWAKDSYDEWSNPLTSTTITKNILTGASLTLSGSIGYNTKTVSVSYSGAKNTNGNTAFNYALHSNHIQIYNHTNIKGTPFNLTIWRTGETIPTTPYIKFDDIKTFARGGSAWSRSASFTLETLNGYGSSISTTTAISVDLKVEPNPPTNITTSGLVTLADNRKYYIPDRGNITVTWSGASDKLGESLTYDLYGKVGSGGYVLLKSGLTTSSTTVTLNKVTAESNYTFKVVAKTPYNKEAYKEAVPIVLHYYNPPVIDFTNVNRTAEGLSVDIVTKVNSSIPSIGFTKRAYSGVVSGTLSKSPQTINKTGLNSGSKYTLTVSVLDDTGLSTEITKTLNIEQYTPIMSVREKGVGVNAIPDGTAKFIVNGKAKVKDLNITGYVTTNTSGNYTNQWTKIAQISINKQYGNTSAEIGFISNGTGGADVQSGTLVARLKQQNALGSAPVGKLYLSNATVTNHDCFKMIITKNTASETVGEIWFKNTLSYDAVYFYPISNNTASSSLTMFEKQPYSASLPSGTQISCISTTQADALTSKDLATTSNHKGKVANIGTDGVMEVGKYIDMHDNSTNDYDVRLQCIGNTLNVHGAMTVNGNQLYHQGNKPTWNDIQSKPSVFDCANDNWFYRSGKYNYLFHHATKNDGSLVIAPSSAVGGWDANWTNEFNFNPDGTFDAKYIKGRDYIEGWTTYTRTITNYSGNNLDISTRGNALALNCGSGSGVFVDFRPKWSGSKGTEPSLFNTSGKGWGYIGGSGFEWYRVYGTGGSVSQRETKYDIQKYDNEQLYYYIKDINTYGYRTISNSKDDEGNVVRELKRKDMQLGCMIDELPTEVVIKDLEGGDGGAVDNYAYTTMVLGATKHLQDKVERLEAENEMLLNRLEKMEELLHGFIEGKL